MKKSIKLKKILILIVSFAVCCCCMFSTSTAIAATPSETSFWKSDLTFSSARYNIDTCTGGIKLSGTALWESMASSVDKVDIDGYSITLKINIDSKASYDYAPNGDRLGDFDTLGVYFAAQQNPYVTDSGAHLLIGQDVENHPGEMKIRIVSATNDIAQIYIPKPADSTYNISFEMTSSSLTVEVNGYELSTESKAIAYALLSRGAYNSIVVNDGRAQGTHATFTVNMTNININIHDSSLDPEVVYGAYITMDSEYIKNKLESDNFRVED